MMKPRERVLRTLRFEPVDRPAFDLMEGMLWPELEDYFRSGHGLNSPNEIIEYLDPDFRWVCLGYMGPLHKSAARADLDPTYSRAIASGPLAHATTIAEVNAYPWPDPVWRQTLSFEAARARWPDHALAMLIWQPLFLTAVDAFGMEAALTNMLVAPQLFDALVARQHEVNIDVLARALSAARGLCDICWIGDDFSGQQALLMNPSLWRKHIKPYLAEEVQLARQHGMQVLYHSCGAVRPVLNDLIEIGVNGLGVFQVTAAGMSPESVAGEFGGRLAFYGGIDVQQLLSYGTVEEVAAQVHRNVAAFAGCGGYIVANSHHRVSTIKGENLLAMCRTVDGMRALPD
jgi:uroporphyrinogen decarboxylase